MSNRTRLRKCGWVSADAALLRPSARVAAKPRVRSDLRRVKPFQRGNHEKFSDEIFGFWRNHFPVIVRFEFKMTFAYSVEESARFAA